METVRSFNLIHFLDFYFALMFFFGTIRRFRQYRGMVEVALAGMQRPRLMKLVREHSTLLMTWATIAPAALALGVWMLQLFLSRFLFPSAGKPPHGLTLGVLFEHWGWLIPAVPIGLAMFSVDLWFLIRVGEIQRGEMEKYFDQAEYWLASPTAHVVRVFTFGYVNPRRMVREEVCKALVAASGLLNNSLWWWNLQVGLRLAFGLTLWLAWLFTRAATV